MHIITKFNTPKSRRWNHIFSKNLRKIRKEVQTSPNLLLEFYIKVYEKSVKCFWLFAHNYEIHYTYRERIKVRLFKKFTENKELVTNWEPNLVAALQFLRFWEYFSLSVDPQIDICYVYLRVYLDLLHNAWPSRPSK